WWIAGPICALAVAWVAFQLQQESIAPAVLLPLGVGTALGALLLAVGHSTRLPSRRLAAAGAIIWGLLAVVAPDYICHRHFVRNYNAELARQHPLAAAAMADDDTLRPTFPRFLANRIAARPAWWTVDVLATCGAAAVVMLWGSRSAALVAGQQLNSSDH